MLDILLCLNNLTCHFDNFANNSNQSEVMLKYNKLNPKDACYQDGIFYPRCKDLENPKVWHYHNLLKNH